MYAPSDWFWKHVGAARGREHRNTRASSDEGGVLRQPRPCACRSCRTSSTGTIQFRGMGLDVESEEGGPTYFQLGVVPRLLLGVDPDGDTS